MLIVSHLAWIRLAQTDALYLASARLKNHCVQPFINQHPHHKTAILQVADDAQISNRHDRTKLVELDIKMQSVKK